jgi:soluble lytic murein transglycosylase-like protein
MKSTATTRALAVLMSLAMSPLAYGMEHVTLRNGFELDCVRREIICDRIRLYMPASNYNAAETNFLEIAADAVVKVEEVPDPPQPAVANGHIAKADEAKTNATRTVTEAPPAKAELEQMLAHAGATHNIDADLLASVVRAESGWQVRAVSHAGAQGLMQLMPGTANELGVKDSFMAEQNIAGGTAYLDSLLVRYHDNIAMALAAYNAGPAAVDRYRGIPPYAETRAYVARVIREFNRRKQMAQTTPGH